MISTKEQNELLRKSIKLWYEKKKITKKQRNKLIRKQYINGINATRHLRR